MTGEPTTWVSRPVCATEAMIEAGADAIRLRYPYMSAGKAWSLAKAVLDAGALASPMPPAVKRTGPVAARDVTEAALHAELAALHAKWDAFIADTEEKGGGSPGEWTVERMEEIETELKRRAQQLAEPPATGDPDHG